MPGLSVEGLGLRGFWGSGETLGFRVSARLPEGMQKPAHKHYNLQLMGYSPRVWALGIRVPYALSPKPPRQYLPGA